MKLYSSWYSPYAQRAWMGLLHKKVAFEYVETNPYEKSAEWMSTSRGTGQVPVLIDNVGKDLEITVPDSIRILEYIDMQYPDGESLYPQASRDLANTKFWVDFQDRQIIPYMYQFLKAEPGSDAADEARKHLEQGLETFASHMDDAGPYFSGDRAGVVDIAFAPFAFRIECLISHYKDYTLPVSGSIWERYHQWLLAMRTFAPLMKTSTDQTDYEERLIEFYLPYSQGGG